MPREFDGQFTAAVCDFDRYGRLVLPSERKHRRHIFTAVQAWLNEQGDGYQSTAQAMEPCQCALLIFLGWTALGALETWIIEAMLRRWFGD